MYYLGVAARGNTHHQACNHGRDNPDFEAIFEWAFPGGAVGNRRGAPKHDGPRRLVMEGLSSLGKKLVVKAQATGHVGEKPEARPDTRPDERRALPVHVCPEDADGAHSYGSLSLRCDLQRRVKPREGDGTYHDDGIWDAG